MVVAADAARQVIEEVAVATVAMVAPVPTQAMVVGVVAAVVVGVMIVDTYIPYVFALILCTMLFPCHPWWQTKHNK